MIFEGGLQSYVGVVVFTNPQNEIRCEIYFKDHMEPWGEFDALEILQELLDIEIIETTLPHNEYYYNFNEHDYKSSAPKDASEIVKILIECNGIQENEDAYIREFEADKLTIATSFFEICKNNDITCNYKTYNEYLQVSGIKFDSSPLSFMVDDKIATSEGKSLIEQRGDGFDCFTTSDTIESIFLDYHHAARDGRHICKFGAYQLSGIVAALTMGVLSIVDRINVCDHCGKIFVPVRADEKYCRRNYNGTSCKEQAKKKVRRERMQGAAVTKKYNSVNTALAARVERCETEKKDALRDKLFQFRDEAQEMKKKYKQGEISENQLIEWYDSWL